MLSHKTFKQFRIFQRTPRWNNQPPTAQKGDKDLRDMRVKYWSGELQDTTIGSNAKSGDLLTQHVGHGPVFDHDALRFPSRARGENCIGYPHGVGTVYRHLSRVNILHSNSLR